MDVMPIRKEVFDHALETLKKARHYHQHLDAAKRIEHANAGYKSQLTDELEFTISVLEGSLPKSDDGVVEE